MKKPKLNLSKDGIVGFFLNHGEKLVVGLFAMLSLGLVWGGVDALRSKQVTRELLPKVITDQATRSREHIGRERNPPPDTAKRTSLKTLMEPWRKPQIGERSTATVFNRPINEERSKRGKPDVFPIEQLRAVAGQVVLALKPDEAAALAAPPTESKDDGGRGKGRGGKGRDSQGGRGGNQPYDPSADGLGSGTVASRGGGSTPPATAPGAGYPGMSGYPGGVSGYPGGEMMGGAGGANTVLNGHLMPYCVVTGLIPWLKQSDEFQARFMSSSLPNPQGDVPVWADYLVERAEVTADGVGPWRKVDLRAAWQQANKLYAGLQPDSLPPDFLLSQEMPPDPNPARRVFGYLTPLPMLAGDVWGIEAVHPWFVQLLLDRKARELEFLKEQAAAAKEGSTPLLSGAGGMPGMPSAPGMGGGYPGGPSGYPGGPGGYPGGPGGYPGGPSGYPGGVSGGIPGGPTSDPYGGAVTGSTEGGYPGGGSGYPGGGYPGPTASPPSAPGGGKMGPRSTSVSSMPSSSSRVSSGGGMGAGGALSDPAAAPMGGMMGSMPGMMGGMGGMPVGPDGQPIKPTEYRLFRFIDFGVEPGKSYTYRVRISVFNPNFEMPAQHLADVGLAKDLKLPSDVSNASEPVAVPRGGTILARTLPSKDAKRLKGGVEVILLGLDPAGDDPEIGASALRSIVTDVGGFANVDKRLNKGGEQRARGEDLATDTLLVDVRGRQELRTDGKSKEPAEPVDLLFLRADGSFDVVAPDDAEIVVDYHKSTLPGEGPPAQAAGPANPYGSPFGGAGPPGSPGGPPTGPQRPGRR